MKRRAFLDGVISVEPVEADDAPAVVGDGIHDDAAGVEAMFSGQPVCIDGETVIVHAGTFRECEFFVSRPIRIRLAGEWEFDTLTFSFDESVNELPVIRINGLHGNKQERLEVRTIFLNLPPGLKPAKLISQRTMH